jgi:hypothetical protein
MGRGVTAALNLLFEGKLTRMTTTNNNASERAKYVFVGRLHRSGTSVLARNVAKESRKPDLSLSSIQVGSLRAISALDAECKWHSI